MSKLWFRKFKSDFPPGKRLEKVKIFDEKGDSPPQKIDDFFKKKGIKKQ
jgi:hypothetical protein